MLLQNTVFRPVILSLVTLLTVPVLFSLPLSAQSEAEPAIAETPDSGTPDSEPSTNPTEEETTANEEWEEIIFIPYKNIKQVLDDQSQVIVPYLEYLKLKTLEQQNQKVQALLQKAEYITRIEGDTARISAQLQFHVWGDKEVTYALSTGEAALGEVKSEQGDVYLEAHDGGETKLVFPQAGDYTVEIEMMVRVQKGTDGKSFVLNIPVSSVTVFDLTVNEGQQKVEVKPEAVPVATTSQEGQTRFRSHLKPTRQIEVNWHPEAGSRPEMNLLTSVDQKQVITIEGEVVLTRAELNYEILRGEMSQLQLAIPLSHTLLDIEAPGTNLKDWNVRKEENRQVIDVSFLSALESNIKLIVQTERPLAEGNLQLLGQSDEGESYSIQALGAVRERGEIIVNATGGLELTVVDKEGVTRFRQNGPDEKGAAADLAFRFFRTDATLTVAVKQIEPRVLATLTHHSTIQEESAETRVTAQLQIEREGLFELQFNVPDDLTIQYVNGTGVSEHRFDEDSRILHVIFSQKTRGPVSLNIGTMLYFETVDPEEVQFLPIIEALNVEKQEGSLFLYSSPSIDIQVLEEDLFGLLPNTIAANQPVPIQQTSGAAPNQLTHSWRYKELPVELYFRVKPKPSLVTSTIASLVDVQEEMIRITSELNYSIQHAGVESFLIQVPENVTDKLRIVPASQSVQSFQQAVPRGDPVDGWQTWLITAQQPVLGNFRLNISYDLPLPSEGPTTDEGLRRYSFSPIRVLEVTPPGNLELDSPPPASLRGEMQIKTARHLSVKGEATGANIENIDVREVVLQNFPDTTLAYQYFSEPVSLEIEIRKYDIQEVLQTVVNKAGVEIILSPDASATYVCHYRVRSSERQRFAISLPTGARPVRVLVNGDETTLEKNDSEPQEGYDSYFLNVSRMTASEEDFFVSLQYIWNLTEAPFTSAGGRLRLPLPIFDGQESGALVQQSRVGIWVPQEYSLLGEPNQFTRSSIMPFRFTFFEVLTRPEESMKSWMALPENQDIDIPRTGNGFYYKSLEQVDRIELTWWQNSFYTWIISITLAVIGFVLLRTSWDNRITLSLCLLLVVALCMLNFSDWVIFTLYAARFGLIFIAILWLFKTWQSYQSNSGETVVVAEPVAATTTGSSDVESADSPTATDESKPESPAEDPSPDKDSDKPEES